MNQLLAIPLILQQSLAYYGMSNKESQDFVEVLEAWARVIGVNLDRELLTNKIRITSKKSNDYFLLKYQAKNQ